jgi:hypothetical protein
LLVAVLLSLIAVPRAHAAIGAASDPSALSTADGKSYVFVRGGDGGVWGRIQASSGTWGQWLAFGGLTTGAPRTVVDTNGGAWVFARSSSGSGVNDLIASRRDPVTGNWSVWMSLGTAGGGTTDGPVPVALEGGRVMVLARRQSDGYFHQRIYSNGVWSPWDGVGLYLAADPTAARSGSTTWIFGRATDGKLYERTLTTSGGFSATFTDLGTPSGATLIGTPQSISPAAGVVQVFSRTTSGRVVGRRYAGGSWGAWEDLGSAAASFGVGAGGLDDVLLAARDTTSDLRVRDAQLGTWGAWSANIPATTGASEPAVAVESSGAAKIFLRNGTAVSYVARSSVSGAWGEPVSLGEPDPYYATSSQYGGTDSDINTGGEWAAAIARWEEVAGGTDGRTAYLNGLSPNDRTELPTAIQQAGPLSFECAGGANSGWNIDIHAPAHLQCVRTKFKDKADADKTSEFWAGFTPDDRNEVNTYLSGLYPNSWRLGGGNFDGDINTGGEWPAAIAEWETVAAGTDGRAAFLNGLSPNDQADLPNAIQGAGPISYECGGSGKWNVEMHVATDRVCVMGKFHAATAAGTTATFWQGFTPLDRNEVFAYISNVYTTSDRFDGTDDIDISSGGEWDAALEEWMRVSGGQGSRDDFTGHLTPNDLEQLPRAIEEKWPTTYECGGAGKWNIDPGVHDEEVCFVNALNRHSNAETTHLFWSGLSPDDRAEVDAYVHDHYYVSWTYGDGDRDISSGGEWNAALNYYTTLSGGQGAIDAFLAGLIPNDRAQFDHAMSEAYLVSVECGGPQDFDIEIGKEDERTCAIRKLIEYADNRDTSAFWQRLTPPDAEELHEYMRVHVSTSYTYGDGDRDINTGGEWDAAIARWNIVKGGAGDRDAFLGGMHEQDQRELNGLLVADDTQGPALTWVSAPGTAVSDTAISVEASDPMPADFEWSGIRTLSIEVFTSAGQRVENWSGAKSFMGEDPHGKTGCPYAMIWPCAPTAGLTTTAGNLSAGTYTVRATATDGVGHVVSDDRAMTVVGPDIAHLVLQYQGESSDAAATTLLNGLTSNDAARVRQAISDGIVTGSVVREANGTSVYYVEGGLRFLVPSQSVADAAGISLAQAKRVWPGALASISQGPTMEAGDFDAQAEQGDSDGIPDPIGEASRDEGWKYYWTLPFDFESADGKAAGIGRVKWYHGVTKKYRHRAVFTVGSWVQPQDPIGCVWVKVKYGYPILQSFSLPSPTTTIGGAETSFDHAVHCRTAGNQYPEPISLYMTGWAKGHLNSATLEVCTSANKDDGPKACAYKKLHYWPSDN